MKRNRFVVIEYSSGYAVHDLKSGQEKWMSDGVDSLFTKSGKAMTPGGEYFRRVWQHTLNECESETAEAYGFPE